MLANISNFWLVESSFSEWSNLNLVGGLEHGWIIVPIILGIVAPTDELIFCRGVGQPSTSNISMIKIRGSSSWIPPRCFALLGLEQPAKLWTAL